MKRILTLATLIAVGAAAWMPLPSMAQTNFSIVIGSAPPPQRFESIPAPRHGYVWAPGYWNWQGNRHAWVSGHWEPERHGYHYQRSEWVRDGGEYRLHRGGWQQVADNGRGLRIAPPPPRYERIPRARHGQIWESGHWEWRGNRHEWVSGVWLAERPGYAYAQPRWQQRDGRWHMEPSRWTRNNRDRDHDGIPDRVERRDRDRDHDGIPDRVERRRDIDGDGVPNRRDIDRDGDGTRNAHDRDRDGDGVRNSHDERPDNPRRY